ncbi:MAG TPA: TIGR01906 family membrane protein [Anaerolineales bacterium]|nr:TIGR01906 family membrane protein [Anaerolineales bacterium]
MPAELSSGQSTIVGVLRRAVLLLMPIVLVLSSVQLILLTAKAWVKIEYKLPGFPPDPYGFSVEDRLHWAAVDIDFLLNRDDIRYFDQVFLGSGEPMHNERELAHMEDVKRLVQVARAAWLVTAALLALLLVVVGRVGGVRALGEVLAAGSKATILVMGVLLVGLLLAFGAIFVGFHRVFFEGGTWLFKYSDTFIRLYPERFWRDVFVLLAAVTVAETGAVYVIARRILAAAARAVG